MLQTLKKFGFTTDELTDVYKGYVRPMMEYADVVWNSSLTKEQVHILEKLQRRACKIILGNTFNSYQEALKICGIETLVDRRLAHCCKFAESLFKCKQTDNIIPPVRKTIYGRELRNSHFISLLPCRTTRFKNSPIPFYINLLNSYLENLYRPSCGLRNSCNNGEIIHSSPHLSRFELFHLSSVYLSQLS